jgi:hypothetical protein
MLRLRLLPGSALLFLLVLPAVAESPPLVEQPRLIVLKVDGLPPWLLEAAVNPENEQAVGLLDNPAEFRRAVEQFRQQLGREQLLPTIERFFFREGVRATQMYSATVTLSAVAWSVIETGQPSIIKGHGIFERDTGYARSYLDGLRDIIDFVKRRGDKTTGVWVLDQVGVPLSSDAFDLERTWAAPQLYYRPALREYLSQMGLALLKGKHRFSEPHKIAQLHLTRGLGVDQSIGFAETFLMQELSRQILTRDYANRERYDLLSGLYTRIDHQQHAEPSPEGLLAQLVRFDELLGEVFHAVEHSQRRDHTFVVMISDHGQEYVPGITSTTVPLSRLFRSSWFGGHTTQTLLSEEIDRALTVPAPGIDRPRVYDSPSSPYGKGWPTAYIEPFGNARAEIHLRNNDLNRLHLVLQAIGRGGWDETAWGRLGERLEETLHTIRPWLPSELAGLRDYQAGVLDWIRFLAQSEDPYPRDTAARLEAEAERLAPQIEALKHLEALLEKANQRPVLAELKRKKFKVETFIPRKFYGPRNSFYQLTHYTIGLDSQQQWVESTVDPKGRSVPLNYFQLLSDFEVANPPTPGNRNPFDLILHAISPESIHASLVEQELICREDILADVAWVHSTAREHPRKGGEALILRGHDGRVKYVPIEKLEQDAAGQFFFQPTRRRDPLALLSDPSFLAVAGEDPAEWLAGWHTPRSWLEAIHQTRYTSAVLMLLDIAGQNYRSFIHDPTFTRHLIGFGSQPLKDRYLRGLERKYANYTADFWTWSSENFNFAFKGPLPGGSHGGLGWRVARNSFLAWGGPQTGLRRGAVLEELTSSLDIAPTLLCLGQRLNRDLRVEPASQSSPYRSFRSFPGQVLDLFAVPRSCGVSEPYHLAAQP